MTKNRLLRLFFILNFVLITPLFAKGIDFTLEDLKGQTVSLSDYRGKDVILFFWAVYCPACRGSLEKAERIFPDAKSSNIVLLSVNIYEDKNKINNFIKNRPVSYPILLDSASKVARQFGLVGIPTFIFIDKEGNVVSQSHSLPDDVKSIFND